MHLSAKEAIYIYKKGCAARCNAYAKVIIIRSILAGIMIGMGAAASSVAAHAVSNVGIARLVAAVVFPVGLMMVILLGAELFTGDCLMVVGLAEKDITPIQFIRMLALVYFGNLIGSIILVCLVVLSGQLDYSGGLLGAYTIKVALSKASITPEKAITSGILCNILVCAAVLMAICAKDVTGKLLVSFFVIMLFVTAGFEHCVANMYYITAGIMAKTNPSYVMNAIENYGITSSQLASLNVKNMIFNNLIPVTIGNVVGGCCFVALPIYYINHNKVVVNNAKEETEYVRQHNDCVSGIAR